MKTFKTKEVNLKIICNAFYQLPNVLYLKSYAYVSVDFRPELP